VLPLLDAESNLPNNKAFNLASVSWGEFFILVAGNNKNINNSSKTTTTPPKLY